MIKFSTITIFVTIFLTMSSGWTFYSIKKLVLNFMNFFYSKNDTNRGCIKSCI